MGQLEQAIRLRQEGKAQEAIELLHTLAEKEPGNADVWYQLAWAHDSLGLERQAVPYYETALSQGLTGKTEQEPFWVSAVHIGLWVSMNRLRSGWKRNGRVSGTAGIRSLLCHGTLQYRGTCGSHETAAGTAGGYIDRSRNT